MTVTSYEEINTCPRQWALSKADYPDLWRGQGYPPKLQVHAVKGSAVHLAVETITKKLILAGCPSVQDPRAANVLKELGGYTKIVTDCIQRVLRRFADNPRSTRLMDGAERTLRGQTPDLRMRVQSILARLRLPPLPEAPEHSSAASAKVRRPLAIGAYPEVELRAPSIRWKGKADLLVITDKHCEITDFKTGAPDEAHGFQVQIYALLWSLDDELNPTRRTASRLVLAYPAGDVEVCPLSEDQLRAFEKDLLERRESAETALAMRPPEARPTLESCRYCGVRHLCDVYWSQDNRPDRLDFEARFSDAQLRILRRHGPMSFDAVLESTTDSGTGKSALLRVQESLELEPGTRFRVLDAGIAVDADDAAQPVIVTLAMFSEIYAVV
jgi:CRISPR/Cas system-associated exonuclease Cas4 (RecB family)